MSTNNSGDSSQQFAYYLANLKDGEFECAFHGLREMSPSIVPKLIAEFHVEISPIIRSELVEIVWTFKRPEILPFLAIALMDESAMVWKSALDGLVALATPDSLSVLNACLTRSFVKRKDEISFRKWVQEAMQQVNETLNSPGQDPQYAP